MEIEVSNTDNTRWGINGKLPINILTLDDLKTYIKLKYRTYQEAGIPAGISKGRARQIVNGFKLPKTPKLIYQIARGWDIDPIKLTIIFSNYNSEQKDSETLDIQLKEDENEDNQES